jgi:hypothetical protein
MRSSVGIDTIELSEGARVERRGRCEGAEGFSGLEAKKCVADVLHIPNGSHLNDVSIDVATGNSGNPALLAEANNSVFEL